MNLVNVICFFEHFLKTGLALLFTLILSSCVSKPPADVNNACTIIKKNPSWYHEAKDVAKRWRVPVPVQFAIIHQESKFDAQAMPKRQNLFGFIPWNRPSTAYGYSQALKGTWAAYKKELGGFWASRDNFGYAVDFIGWYANIANRRAHIPRADAYALYLAYHEGVGGYLRRTYLNKPWLVQVAKRVKTRSEIYEAQLRHCT